MTLLERVYCVWRKEDKLYKKKNYPHVYPHLFLINDVLVWAVDSGDR